jgi:hypothetical protein
MNDIPEFWLILAVIAVTILVLRRVSVRRRLGKLGLGADVDADLLHACRGDQQMASRLIEYELKRRPDLSRPGAALMALSRLRDEKR